MLKLLDQIYLVLQALKNLFLSLKLLIQYLCVHNLASILLLGNLILGDAHIRKCAFSEFLVKPDDVVFDCLAFIALCALRKRLRLHQNTLVHLLISDINLLDPLLDIGCSLA